MLEVWDRLKQSAGDDAWSGSDYDSATQLSARQRHKQSFLMRVAKKRERAVGKENCHTEGSLKDMSKL